jgi:hypothetical protein
LVEYLPYYAEFSYSARFVGLINNNMTTTFTNNISDANLEAKLATEAIPVYYIFVDNILWTFDCHLR